MIPAEELSAAKDRALAMLSNECQDLMAHIYTLAQAIRDIEYAATVSEPEFKQALASIIHICQTGGVRAALEAS